MLFRFWVFPDCTFLDISIWIWGVLPQGFPLSTCAGARGPFLHKRRVALQPFRLHPPSAHRIAAFLGSRPGMNRCFPNMTLWALPPDHPVAASCHHLWRQAAVQRRIPLPERGDVVTLHAVVIQGCSQKSSPLFTAVSVGYSHSSGLCCLA